MSVARSRHVPISLEAGDALSEASPPAQRHGKPILVRPRLGQGTFRVVVTDAYTRACAVTGEHSLPALEAAHIRPYSHGGVHEVSNGLLLRSDIHRLFDRGYVTVTKDLRFEVRQRFITLGEQPVMFEQAAQVRDVSARAGGVQPVVAERDGAGSLRRPLLAADSTALRLSAHLRPARR